MMVLNELKINNFGIYAGEHCIDFRLCDETKNVTLIGGMNGRGKTTILEAILLSLYGKRSISFIESELSYTDYLRKFINKTNEAGISFVELSFSLFYDTEVIEIKLNRSWDNNKTRISDKLQVWRNNNIDKHLSDNWNVYVEEILPSGIAGLFFFDGEKITRLAEEETNDEMKKSIKSLLGIDTIDRLLLDLKRISSKKEGEISFIRDNEELNKLSHELSSIELLIEATDQDIKGINTRNFQLHNDLNKKEQEFYKKGGNLGISRSELLIEKQNLIATINEQKSSLIELVAGPLPLLLVKPLIDKIYNTVKEEENIRAAKSAKFLLHNLESRFTKSLSLVDASDSAKVKILQFFKDEYLKLRTLEDKKQIFDISPIALQLIESINFNEIVKKAVETIKHIEKLELAVEQIEQHLLVNVDEKVTNKLLNSIKEIAQKIAANENELAVLSKKIIEFKAEKTKFETQYKKVSQKILDEKHLQDDASRVLKYSNMSMEVMSAFKVKVQAKKVQLLASNIMTCFNEITHKQALVSKIIINPETLNLTLLDSEDKLLLKSQLSAGEKQMLAISILWGLAKSSGQSLPVIIDTPLGRLDSSHRTNFVTQYLPNASKQVVVLSTDEEIKGTYLDMLDKHICKKYLLRYDDERKATDVIEGYFKGEAS
jgi:DNA sulfur modification protein DndD